MSSRPFQEQPAREVMSLDLAAVPFLDFAEGTRDVTVFLVIDLHGSGSAANFAGSTVGSAFLLALGDADDSDEPDSFLSPESDEQPHDDEHHRDGGAGEYAGESRG